MKTHRDEDPATDPQQKPLECSQCKSQAGAREYELVEERGTGLEPYRYHAICCAVHAVEWEKHFAVLKARTR